MKTENLAQGPEACLFCRLYHHLAGQAVFSKTLGLILLVLIAASCIRDVDVVPVYENEKLVIEGHLETGKTARVLITKSIPFFEILYTTELLDILVLDAEVFIHCGEESEQLFLVKDDILPEIPVYRGSKIKGEVGKEYRLEVRWEEDVFTATDQMLEPVAPEKLWFSLEPGEDSLGYVNLDIRDPAGDRNYYRIWAKRLNKDSIFLAVSQDILNDFYFDGTDFSLPLTRDASILSRPDTAFFRRGEIVAIKLAHLTSTFYEVINNVKYEATNLINPFAIHFEAFSNIEGNAIGGFGCYSTALDTLRIE